MNGSVLQCFSVSFLSPWPIMVTSIFCSSIFIGSLVAMSHYVMVSESFFFWIKGTFWYSTETKRRSSSCVCVCLLSLGLFIFLSNSALCVFYGRGGLVCHSFQSSISRVSFLVSGSTLRSCSATTRRLPNLVPDERSTKNLQQTTARHL